MVAIYFLTEKATNFSSSFNTLTHTHIHRLIHTHIHRQAEYLNTSGTEIYLLNGK